MNNVDFVLAATAVGAVTGYLIRELDDDNTPIVSRVLNVWEDQRNLFIPAGAVLGLTYAGASLMNGTQLFLQATVLGAVAGYIVGQLYDNAVSQDVGDSWLGQLIFNGIWKSQKMFFTMLGATTAAIAVTSFLMAGNANEQLTLKA